MPRPERPVDAEDSELGQFAADLRKLREKAGKPSYRELSARAHYSTATLADAASGKKLPSLAVTLAYVAACGGAGAEWEERWRAIAAPPEPTGEAPYVGLQAFQPEDAERFFGREKLTASLVELVARRPFVGVFGASGSGKSSLLRAGLVPNLATALVFTPGARPREECAVRLAQLTGQSAVRLRGELADPAALGLLVQQHDEDLVLVVDQFEEVFTLCEPEQRDWFVAALTRAPHVVIGVRADFYGHVGRHPELVDALAGAHVLVGPMTADELRRAITEPSQRAGAVVENALVTRLVADVAGQAAVLPLVQHALAETWHRRRGMTLSLASYEEAGGVEHAIARTAEAVFNDLTFEQQATAKRIFLRLIALGEGTEDTKRRAVRADLDAVVLESLAGARLVTLSEEHVELTHEALIRSWPRLRDWIAEDRAKLRVHHQLTEAATQWDGTDPDVLYQGARLEQAGELDQAALTAPERAFLGASQAKARRRARRVRVVVSVLSVLVVLLAGTAVFAVRQVGEVTRQKEAAVARSAALSVRWMILREPKNALRVAMAAHRVSPSDETRDVILMADAAAKQVASPDPEVRYVDVVGGRYVSESRNMPDDPRVEYKAWPLPPQSKQPLMVLPGMLHSTSADGSRVLVMPSDNTIALMDVSVPARPRELAKLPGRIGRTTPLTKAGDMFAGILVNGTDPRRPDYFDDRARLWTYDGAGGFREFVLPVAEVVDVSLSGNGKLLTVERKKNGQVTIELWRVDGGVPSRASAWGLEVADWHRTDLSDDGAKMALRNEKKSTFEVWDTSDPANPTLWDEIPAPAGRLPYSAFSDGNRLLAIGSDYFVQVWDIGQRQKKTRVASFDGFEKQSYGMSYVPSRQAFVTTLLGESIWFLRTDLGQVMKDWCAEPAMRLSTEEWQRHLPDITAREVC